jgi:hypothetical protein
VLATALAVHVVNALWSIYIRRTLRLPAWELTQLSLGLWVPPLLMPHVVGTKISDRFLGTVSEYDSVFAIQWVVTPWLVYLQVAAVLTLWVHACIGLHFWLRTKRWYRTWLPILGMLGVLIPSLALAGYISGGNQILREAQNPRRGCEHPRKCSRNARNDRPSLAYGARRVDHLCRTRRARIGQPHTQAPTIDPLQWTHHGDTARCDGA